MKLLIKKRITFSLLFLLSLGIVASSLKEEIASEIDIVVSKDNTGDYATIQDAINAVADGNMERTVIFIHNGIYHEKIIIPYKKKNITLVGENVDSTVISYNDNPNTVTDGNTFLTQTFRADAENFNAYNLTFENTSGNVGQAVAFSSFGDKQMFYHCKFLGWQDTYYINYRCRNYMKDCYIEGAVDYIFGYGIGLYDSCQMHTVRQGGVITAASTSKFLRFGLTFKNCKITSPSSISDYALGRPWQGRPHVAYIYCHENTGIRSAGWTAMGSGLNPLFAEYKCEGEGYKPDERSTNVDYPGIQLSDEDAKKYLETDTIFAVASFAKPGEDSLEIDEMYAPFIAAGLTRQFSIVMKSGRDTFPPIPTDDWEPRLYEDVILRAVKKHSRPFMDSILPRKVVYD